LFYRTQYNGQTFWVPSIWIDGYPPSNPPLLPPDDGDDDNPPPPPGNSGFVYLSTEAATLLEVNLVTGEQRPIYTDQFLTDVALSPDGRLYGCSFWDLFEIDVATGQMRHIGEFPDDLSPDVFSINALAFSPDGQLYGADQAGTLFSISTENAQLTQVGYLGGPSSGDLVFYSNSQFYATIGGPDLATDQLVSVDITAGQSQVLFDLGVDEVYGLALVNGTLTGYSSAGNPIKIDPNAQTVEVQAPIYTYDPLTGATAGIASIPDDGDPGIVIGGYTIDGVFYNVWEQYQGTLGNPIENVKTHASGATYQLFENGSIVSSQHGTFPLYGAIRQGYLNESGLNGWLGAPTSGEVGQGNGVIKQTFENGYIIWNGVDATAYEYETPPPPPPILGVPDILPAKKAIIGGGVVDSSIQGSFASDILDAVNRGVIRKEVAFFLMSILATESGGGNWQANNGLGYLGAFQISPSGRAKFAPNVSDAEFLSNPDIQMQAAQGLYDEKLAIIRQVEQNNSNGWTTEPDQQPLDQHFAGKSEGYKVAYAWLTLYGVDGNGVYSKDYAQAADESAKLIEQTLDDSFPTTDPGLGEVSYPDNGGSNLSPEVLQSINSALNNLDGDYSITDPNGNYPGQCVSFVKRFTQSLGITMNPMGGNGGAKYGFMNFNQPNLSLSASQADQITFNGQERPEVGDIIFFDSTSQNPWGHVAVVQSVLGDGQVIIQESNGDGKAPNTYVRRSAINLKEKPPAAYYGSVMGWLRLKL
jgi:surface antigen